MLSIYIIITLIYTAYSATIYQNCLGTTSSIFPNQYLLSQNKKYKLELLSTGNLCIYNNNQTTWCTNVLNQYVTNMFISSGKLMAISSSNYDGSGSFGYYWAPHSSYNTAMTGITYLIITNNGNFVLYNNTGIAWSCSMGTFSSGGACPLDSSIVMDTVCVSNTNSPTKLPSQAPSIKPTFPTLSPSFIPTREPSIGPSCTPTINPSYIPTISPSVEPSYSPTIEPSFNPTISPTIEPSYNPSIEPSYSPTIEPSYSPSIEPSYSPSIEPSYNPSIEPSYNPSVIPTIEHSLNPTIGPSIEPSYNPSTIPTIGPSYNPSTIPTIGPSYNPSQVPSYNPSQVQSQLPSHISSQVPSQIPSHISSQVPSQIPYHIPSQVPTQNLSLSLNLNNFIQGHFKVILPFYYQKNQPILENLIDIKGNLLSDITTNDFLLNAYSTNISKSITYVGDDKLAIGIPTQSRVVIYSLTKIVEITGVSNSFLGYSIESIRNDTNLAISAPYYSGENCISCGAVYIIFNISKDTNLNYIGDNFKIFLGHSNYEYFGISLTSNITSLIVSSSNTLSYQKGIIYMISLENDNLQQVAIGQAWNKFGISLGIYNNCIIVGGIFQSQQYTKNLCTNKITYGGAFINIVNGEIAIFNLDLTKINQGIIFDYIKLTSSPSITPTIQPSNTRLPTYRPTKYPINSVTPISTEITTEIPTESPTDIPTEFPTEFPTEILTESPTEIPIESPTEISTEIPTEFPTKFPTQSPIETAEPTYTPSRPKFYVPTLNPTYYPQFNGTTNSTNTFISSTSKHILEISVSISAFAFLYIGYNLYLLSLKCFQEPIKFYVPNKIVITVAKDIISLSSNSSFDIFEVPSDSSSFDRFEVPSDDTFDIEAQI